MLPIPKRSVSICCSFFVFHVNYLTYVVVVVVVVVVGLPLAPPILIFEESNQINLHNHNHPRNHNKNNHERDFSDQWKWSGVEWSGAGISHQQSRVVRFMNLCYVILCPIMLFIDVVPTYSYRTIPAHTHTHTSSSIWCGMLVNILLCILFFLRLLTRPPPPPPPPLRNCIIALVFVPSTSWSWFWS